MKDPSSIVRDPARNYALGGEDGGKFEDYICRVADSLATKLPGQDFLNAPTSRALCFLLAAHRSTHLDDARATRYLRHAGIQSGELLPVLTTVLQAHGMENPRSLLEGVHLLHRITPE